MADLPLLRRLSSSDPVAVPRPTSLVNDLQRQAANSPVMNRQLQELRKTQDAQDAEAAKFDIPPVTTLVGYALEGFNKARQFKISNGTQQELFEALRNFKGNFSCEELEQNGGPGTAKWFPLTEMMVQRMHAFLTDALADSRERPRYDFESTSVPEVPSFMIDGVTQLLEQQIIQLYQEGVIVNDQQLQKIIDAYAERLVQRVQDASAFALKKTKRLVDDKLDESNYRSCFNDVLLDGCIYGTGLKFGPERVIKLRPGYESDDNPDEFTDPETAPEWKYRKEWHWRKLDPLHFFPSACSTNGCDGEAWYYVDKMSRHDLFLARSCPGWIPDNIEHVLRDDCQPYTNWTDTMWGKGADALRGRSSSHLNDDRLDVLWRYGYLPGRMLIQMGFENIDGKKIVPFGEYDVQLKIIGDKPVMITCNIDPQGCRGLHKFVLYKCPDAFWGRGIHHKIGSKQCMVNASFRSVGWNMGFSAVPQYEINKSLLAQGVKITDVIPGMMIEKETADTGLTGDVLKIHQAQSNAAVFMAILRECIEQAELLLGLPRFLTGASAGGGAASTASGLNQLQNNAFINIKSIIVNIDQGLTQSAMSKMYRLVIAINKDPDLAGDARVVTLGASAMLARQVNRDNLFGQIGALLPFMQAQLIPQPLIDEILRELIRHMGLDASLLPDRIFDQAEQIQLMEALQQAGGINGGVAGAAQGGGTGVAGGGFQQQQAGGQVGGLAAAQ